MSDYTTTDDVKSTLNLVGESFADADIARGITAASRAIDHICKRRFYPDADATSERLYTATSRRVLEIDDLITLTSVTLDLSQDGTFTTTWTRGTEFVLKPSNAEADARPFEYLKTRNGHCFSRREEAIKVTGKFGWAAVPAEIEQATIVLASKLMRRAREAPFGVLSLGMEGAVARIAMSDPDVMMLVGPFVNRLMR